MGETCRGGVFGSALEARECHVVLLSKEEHRLLSLLRTRAEDTPY